MKKTILACALALLATVAVAQEQPATDEVVTVPELDKEREQAKADKVALAECRATLQEIAPMAAARARQLFINPQETK